MKEKKPPDLKSIKRYEDYKTSYKTIKTSLKSITKHDITIEKINNVVVMMNKIIIHTYQFIKLYYLYCYHNKKELHQINEELINSVMKILCKEDTRGRKPKQEIILLKTKLKSFYDKHYSKLIDKDEVLSYTNLNTMIDYETISILTDYENHICNHFIDFFNRFINVSHNKSKIEKDIREEKISQEEKKEKISEFRKELKKVKEDLLNISNDNLTSSDKYHNWIKKTKKIIFTKVSYKENSIYYDVKCNPLDYLKSLIYMSIEIENKKEKTFSCFPLRTNIIPKNVIFDTTTLIHLFINKKDHKHTKDYYLTKGNTISLRNDIWKFFFRTDKKIFGNATSKYVFNYQMQTDGIGASINLIRRDLYNEDKKNKVRTVKKPKGYKEEKYIDELTQEQKDKYRDYIKVGIDPGVRTLLFGTNGETKIIDKENGKTKHKTTVFKYTQDQRRKETKIKKYMKITDNDKKETIINNTTVKKYEETLSKYDSKSCIYKNVKSYIKEKNKVNKILFGYYEKELYRKFKWYGYINRQRTENNMINNFKKVFGEPDKVVIGIGDYCQKQHLKYKEPVKGKGFRKTFKRAGYDIYLVDEYKTSAISYLTEKENENFRKRGNPKPYKNNIMLWHGLLRSTNVPNSNSKAKHVLYDRDKNGAINIRRIFCCHLEGKERPKIFSRKKE